MQKDGKSVNRELLYEEVWTEPVSVVAPRYGLSDVGLAKICRRLAIPLPSRGYWAKVRSGKIMKRAALPRLDLPDVSDTGLVPLPPEQLAARREEKEVVARVKTSALDVEAQTELPNSPHPLIVATAKRLKRRDGWTEQSGLRCAPTDVLNVSVTAAAIDRALALVDSLLRLLAGEGFEAAVDPSRGATYLEWKQAGTRIEFSVVERVNRARHEMTPKEERARKRYFERSRWESSMDLPHVPMYDYTPTGKLSITAGRWPSRTWNDTARTPLESRIAEVVAGIITVARETHERELEQVRREEQRRIAQARYEYVSQRRASEVERFQQLETAAANWERARRIRAYVDAMEANARERGEGDIEIMEWRAWAMAKADWLDPSIEVSDPILDAPEPKPPPRW